MKTMYICGDERLPIIIRNKRELTLFNILNGSIALVRDNLKIENYNFIESEIEHINGLYLAMKILEMTDKNVLYDPISNAFWLSRTGEEIKIINL